MYNYKKRVCEKFAFTHSFKLSTKILQLWTCSNKCFTSFISFVFSEVLDKSLCKIFCFFFPFRSVSVCVTRIKDTCVNTLKFCRNFKVEVWDCLCRSVVDCSVQDSIDDTTCIFDRDTFSCSVPSCIYEISPLFSIFLTSSSAYFVGCNSRNACPKQAENVGVGSVIPRSVPASFAVNPDKK